MVFFTCNACGQAVKKNQVEKHYTTKCRNCTVLSCIDCGKDFCGDEYQSHTKCITEDEKYGGKDFKPKQSSGKGEAKQANWIANIKSYISSANLPKNLVNLLNNLTSYSNIPRKKEKFKNFLINSVRIKDNYLGDAAWDIFIQANQSKGPTNVVNNQSQNSTSDKELDKTNKQEVEVKKNEDRVEELEGENEQNCSERKRKKKGKVKEEVPEQTEENNNNGTSEKKHKKHKKHRKEEEEPMCPDNNGSQEDNSKKKRKKMKVTEQSEESNEVCEKELHKDEMEEQESVLLNNGGLQEEDGPRKHKKKRKHESETTSAKNGAMGYEQHEDVGLSDTVENSSGKSKKKKHKKVKSENDVLEDVVNHHKKKRKHVELQENGSNQN